MGLLDDAIREHLEFKRQRGADPGVLAREEHEALGPVDRGDNAVSSGVAGSPVAVAQQLEEQAPSPKDAPSRPVQDTAPGGQETAELDMRTVLKTEQSVRAAAVSAEESLEWEVPGGSSPRQRATTEGEAIADGEADGDAEKQAEDVLEETPDFLSDTPDQERLWFEQQPPRDFDFDK